LCAWGASPAWNAATSRRLLRSPGAQPQARRPSHLGIGRAAHGALAPRMRTVPPARSRALGRQSDNRSRSRSCATSRRCNGDRETPQELLTALYDCERRN
jgi:hypothetical protein